MALARAKLLKAYQRRNAVVLSIWTWKVGWTFVSSCIWNQFQAKQVHKGRHQTFDGDYTLLGVIMRWGSPRARSGLAAGLKRTSRHNSVALLLATAERANYVRLGGDEGWLGVREASLGGTRRSAGGAQVAKRAGGERQAARFQQDCCCRLERGWRDSL